MHDPSPKANPGSSGMHEDIETYSGTGRHAKAEHADENELRKVTN